MPGDDTDRAAGRIMFEIYREADFNRRVRVVYFTELDEHERDSQIDAALAGEPLYSGFLTAARIAEAKEVIAAFLDKSNESGASMAELDARLAAFLTD